MGETADDITALAASAFSMIGIEEFARRMAVCANTVRNWIDAGLLVPGIHFLRVGRVIRFPSDQESVMRLIRDLSPPSPPRRPRLKSQQKNRKKIKLKC